MAFIITMVMRGRLLPSQVNRESIFRTERTPLSGEEDRDLVLEFVEV
jgi:hypothetical protein